MAEDPKSRGILSGILWLSAASILSFEVIGMLLSFEQDDLLIIWLIFSYYKRYFRTCVIFALSV
jgi:hypothetical protein